MVPRDPSPGRNVGAALGGKEEADRLIALGDRTEASGDRHEACEHYRKAVKAAPGYAKAQLSLGVVLEGIGDAAGAIGAYEAALAGDPENPNPNASYNLGKLLYTRGGLGRAEALLQSALVHKPEFPEAQVVLASVFETQGKLELAAAALEVALKQRPDWPGALCNYAAVLKKLGRLDEAEAVLSRVVSIEPDNADASYELAILLHVRDALQEAKKMLQRVLELNPQFPKAHAEMGGVCKGLGDYAEAENCFRTAIVLDPDYVGAYYLLGDILYSQGEREMALSAFENALSLRPDFIEARWAHMMAQIPAVYDDSFEVAPSRAAFARELEEIRVWAGMKSTIPAHELVGMIQPFDLAYTPENNRELLARHGEFCARMMGDWLRALGPMESHCGDRDRIKVGIVSAHVFDHSVWNAIIKGWVTNLDASRFSVSIFHLGARCDDETAFARSSVVHFEQGPKSVNEWVRSVLARCPDALIYAEIGMDPTTLRLASLRLAPVQAATWGHPETTGLPTIDYYLSAECLEPVGAEAHYTEALVRLPGLGVCYQPVPVQHVVPDLQALEIDRDRPVLLNPGTPFKYSPRYDWVFIEIARRLGDCQLIFFVGRNKALSERLQRRLSAAFSASGLDFDRQVKFVPWLDRANFHGLMKRADVFLDSIGFSGFNTAMQAVDCGLPIVAREGCFMRGRLASGILDRMGLLDLVAKSDNEYIDLAVRLASDEDYRQSVSARMSQARGILYNDVEPVRALEEFLEKVAVNRNESQV